MTRGDKVDYILLTSSRKELLVADGVTEDPIVYGLVPRAFDYHPMTNSDIFEYFIRNIFDITQRIPLGL